MVCRVLGPFSHWCVPQDLYDKKEFHNPGILELLMSQYNILEKGSNYPEVRCRSTARTRCWPRARCAVRARCASVCAAQCPASRPALGFLLPVRGKARHTR